MFLWCLQAVGFWHVRCYFSLFSFEERWRLTVGAWPMWLWMIWVILLSQVDILKTYMLNPQAIKWFYWHEGHLWPHCVLYSYSHCEWLFGCVSHRSQSLGLRQILFNDLLKYIFLIMWPVWHTRRICEVISQICWNIHHIYTCKTITKIHTKYLTETLVLLVDTKGTLGGCI